MNPVAMSAVLTWNRLLLLVIMLLAVIVVTGVAMFVRATIGKSKADESIVRSWIALMLVAGLLILAGFSFSLDDTDLRNLILGGITASAGSAIAFYFSSKGSEGARKDILDATFGTATVPDLDKKDPATAQQIVAGTAFSLRYDNPQPPAATATINKQSPAAGTVARRGSEIVVTYT